MNATVLAEMYAAGVVAEDKRACDAAFEEHWQRMSGSCPLRREEVELIFDLGWIARANWAAELNNPVADQTPGRVA